MGAADRSLILLASGGPVRVRKLALQGLEAAECDRGRYGQTLRLRIAGQTHSLSGCNTTYAVLAARTLPERHALLLAQTALDDKALAQALHAFADLALRAQPLPQAQHQAQQLRVQAVARARSDGLVQDCELVG